MINELMTALFTAVGGRRRNGQFPLLLGTCTDACKIKWKLSEEDLTPDLIASVRQWAIK
jgi:hypothetical protein